MNALGRFVEVGRLLEQDDQIRLVAEQVVGALEGLDDTSLSRVASDETARDQLLQQLWDEIVEPLQHNPGDTFDMWRMSMEGVVIDNLITLWASADRYDWRSRIRGLLALQPA